MLISLIIILAALSAVVTLFGGWYWRRNHLKAAKGTVGIAAAFLLVVGLGLLTLGARGLKQDLDARHWATTMGEIVNSEVIGVRAFHPEITYHYRVSGREYTGVSTMKMPGFGNRRSRLSTAEILAGQYPPGRTVTVHYDAADPSRSTLNAGLSYAPSLRFTLGLILYLAGLFVIPAKSSH